MRNERDTGWMIAGSEWFGKGNEENWAWFLSLSENRPERILNQEE